MAIRPIKVGIVERSDSLFTLGNGVASFNAEFIKKNNLEKMAYVKFYMDDEDPYFLGFEFFEYSEIDSLRLMAPSRENKSTLTTGATRRVKTGGLTNQHRIARAVSKLKNIDDRAFEIIKNPNEKYFKVYFRPIFENEVKFESKNQIPAGIGIYRYLDSTGALIYIGKGEIRDRASSSERIEWGIEKIQYSFLNNDDECFKWENFYLKSFEDEHGILPAFNRISGRNS